MEVEKNEIKCADVPSQGQIHNLYLRKEDIVFDRKAIILLLEWLLL